MTPILIFSGKTRYKAAAIKGDPYLKFCLDQLSQEKFIFTFGCSFKIDKHLLDKILEGKVRKEIFFGVLNDEAKKIISDYIQNTHPQQIPKHKICFVNLRETEKVQKIIWKEQIDIDKNMDPKKIFGDSESRQDPSTK